MLTRIFPPGKRLRRLVIAGGACAIVLSIALIGVQALSAATPVSLPTISNSVLSTAGITLVTPNAGTTYPVSQADASAAALSAFRGGTVVDSRLVHLMVPSRHPSIDAVCWAVSTTGNTPPSLGPPRPAPLPQANYLVVFINATTGAVDFWIAN